MQIPDIKEAKRVAQVERNEGTTIACVCCKKPLWLVQIHGQYGGRVVATKTPYPGTPPYKDYWEKDQRTPKRTDCPHCGENYFKVIEGPRGIKIPKPYIPEWDGVA